VSISILRSVGTFKTLNLPAGVSAAKLRYFKMSMGKLTCGVPLMVHIGRMLEELANWLWRIWYFLDEPY